MLKFVQDPDIIFSQILDHVFVHAIDFTIGNHLDERPPCPWDEELPRASKVFSPETALATVKELQKYHQDVCNSWELNDYHYLLLYELLDDFCAYTNDTARDLNMPFATIDEVKIWRVDFEAISEIYFPDTDFLIPRDRLENLNAQEKEKFGFRPETFSIVMGFKPHPDELKPKLLKTGHFVPGLPSEEIFQKDSTEYPDLRDT